MNDSEYEGHFKVDAFIRTAFVIRAAVIAFSDELAFWSAPYASRQTWWRRPRAPKMRWIRRVQSCGAAKSASTFMMIFLQK